MRQIKIRKFVWTKCLLYLCIVIVQLSLLLEMNNKKKMKITLVRDDGKVNTLRTLKIELLLEQMKTEVKAQPVSKMREALRYTLPGNSIEGVRKVPKVIPAAAFVRKEGVMTLNEYNGIVMMEVNHLSGRTEADEDKGISQRVSANVPRFHRLLR